MPDDVVSVLTPKPSAATPMLVRLDIWIAVGMGLLATLIYTLALAPDILYSDSGEFQTLTYTWGITHPTGYPVYLLLARIVSFIPINTLAWRVNFFSALAGGVTVGTLYLLVRHFTQRGGAILASMVLLLSYTFWAQSIIAEVYTPATALISLVLFLLMLWRQQPVHRRWLLFLSAFLLGLGIGVHLFLVLIAPAVLIFVLWGILFGSPDERGRWEHLLSLVAGGIIGVVVFFLLFVFMDARPTPTSFYTTTIIPSRDAWELEESDLDTVFERFWLSVSGKQWQDAMVPETLDYAREARLFFTEHLTREYTLPTLILAVLGALTALVRHRRFFALIAVAVLVAFVAGLVYQPGDKFIFYLPVYLLVALFAGVGAGYLIQWGAALIPQPIPKILPHALLTLVLIGLCIQPLLASRIEAIQTGKSEFVAETYPYPVGNLQEPRLRAECAVSKVAEDNAYLVLDWRALYAIYYVAHVEQRRTGLIIREVQPHGTQFMTENLRAEIAAQVAAGVPVYVDREDPALRRLYTMTPVSGNCRDYNLFILVPRS